MITGCVVVVVAPGAVVTAPGAVVVVAPGWVTGGPVSGVVGGTVGGVVGGGLPPRIVNTSLRPMTVDPVKWSLPFTVNESTP